MTSFVTLNGDIGSIVSRFFTSSSDAEQPDVAHGADARMLGHQLLVVARHHLAHLSRVLHQVVLFVHADRGERGGHRDRVACCRSSRRRTRCPSKCVGDLAAACPRRPAARSDDVRPLAHVMMSGTTSQWFTANHSPVRPKPHMISSAIIRMPYFVHSSRTPCR